MCVNNFIITNYGTKRPYGGTKRAYFGTKRFFRRLGIHPANPIITHPLVQYKYCRQ